MANGSTRQWRKLRLAILARDDYRCMMVEGCTTRATHVDHITRLMDGGARYDPANLRAACEHHNTSDGASAGNRLRYTSYDW